MRALLHAHSDFSYDGCSTLRELSAWGAERGLDFILLSEHINDFDESKMDRYVEAVDAQGTEECRLIPGLEFAVRGGFHVLGYNVRRWKQVVDPLEAVRFIRAQGGLAVLAHPARYRGRWLDGETMRHLNGIEVWNARYDGRFLPSGEILESATSACAGLPGVHFFGGQDLHDRSSHRLVETRVEGRLGTEEFLAALGAGRASFGASGFWFDARSRNGSLSRALLKLGHRSYRLARGLRDRMYGQEGQAGR